MVGVRAVVVMPVELALGAERLAIRPAEPAMAAGARPLHARDPVAGRVERDMRPDRLDDAGAPVPEDERKPDATLHDADADQVVVIAHAGRVVADEHLAGPERRNRPILKLHHVVVAGL